MELLGDVGHLESHFFLFGDSVTIVRYRCMVFARHTIDSEIVLDALDGTTGWRGTSGSLVHLEIVLIFRQDWCTVCVEHTIGSKITLDTRWIS
jgi:hypothetical protein